MSANARPPVATSGLLGAVWLWAPAVGGLLVFGGVAIAQFGEGPLLSWWALSGAACAAAYAARERLPVAALIVSLLVVATARLPGVDVLRSGFDVVYLLVLFIPVLPLIVVAGALPLRWSALAAAATLATSLAVAPDPPWTTSTSAASAPASFVAYVLNLGVPVMVVLGAWVAGAAMFARQRYAEALLDRAVSLERAREADAARSAAEERAQLARELHDVVTHTVAVMVVQASAANAIWESDPAQARASLQAVEESGRTAMADLREMLDAMRANDAPESQRPRPGLESLPALVDQIRTAGLSASLTVDGAVSSVELETDRSLLRIAQEAVTNALRHAHASTIAVELDIGEADVRLSVADDGEGFEATASGTASSDAGRRGGHGLVGMRERADLVGATLDVTSGRTGTVVSVRAPRERDA